ncbi:CAAX amino protease [Pseudoclavibacter endophyticus]|uniref:CPBP family intramembrane metalloprotease n=1 Tax=Pseudoclavibacter endophyticus TaxID=1778590 RepID=A0A6H9WMV4_9MICO|nr:CPBP family intramembrane glutamic endopeptidase [Pseudoclavibacter endophyticus]KAB1649091.1 CPBP family intramembrane metalloprotease [Pseudoclavibacter endophyticus]GGA65533.1 CAAX amino protease [Pseudoclavibacter endophyticus]
MNTATASATRSQRHTYRLSHAHRPGDAGRDASGMPVGDGAPAQHDARVRMRRAVTVTLAISFGAVLAITVPSMLGIGGTEWLSIATPVAQWFPAVAVLVAARVAGLRLPVSKLLSLGPVRASRGAGTWGWAMALVGAALVAFLAMHFGIATLTGTVEWTAGVDVLPIAVMVVPMLAFAAVAALGEEVAWRGFLWQAWRERFGLFGTILATTGVWVLWHLPLLAAYGIAGDMSWRAVLASLASLAFASALLGIARERGGNVWPAVLGHALMNSMLVFATSNLVTPADSLTDSAFWAFQSLGWAVWAIVLSALSVTVPPRPRAMASPAA